MGVHAKLKQHDGAFRDFSKLFDSPEFRDELKKAVDNPTSKTAKSILNKVTPILAFQDNASSFTRFDGIQSKGKLFSMARRYGGVSAFITIAPDSINNPMCFRMSLMKNNAECFPTVCDTSFLESMKSLHLRIHQQY